MKGMDFTGLVDKVEEKFSPAMADQITCATPGRTGGAYTAVGKYDHTELVNLVLARSHATPVPVPELTRTCGRHLHDLALGLALIEGAATPFEEPVTVTQRALEDGSGRFEIHQTAHAAAA